MNRIAKTQYLRQLPNIITVSPYSDYGIDVKEI